MFWSADNTILDFGTAPGRGEAVTSYNAAVVSIASRCLGSINAQSGGCPAVRKASSDLLFLQGNLLVVRTLGQIGFSTESKLKISARITSF
jgi:hypothetical protein